jgi:misacylated tRNA(Ala) deacylase
MPGGGQPADHGTVLPLKGDSPDTIPIRNVQREGLRCLLHSPQPLSPGDQVRQVVDFSRRWDHMQQHTGQHLLSAVMNSYDNLNTLGWGMGKEGEMNYVDLPRKPAPDEIREIQDRCNELIRENLPIRVETPNDAKDNKLPGDYDKSLGVIRVVRIGDLDRNTYSSLRTAARAVTNLLRTDAVELTFLKPRTSP